MGNSNILFHEMSHEKKSLRTIDLDHNILSSSLNENGIYGQVHSFISFFSPRTSSVKINYSLSLPYVNIHGVPQGSVIGPILFIIYILPIKSIVHTYPNIHYHLYADDL